MIAETFGVISLEVITKKQATKKTRIANLLVSLYAFTRAIYPPIGLGLKYLLEMVNPKSNTINV